VNKNTEYDPSTILNVPNILMFFRVGLTPFLLIFLVMAGHFQIPGLWQTSNENGDIKYRIIALIIFIIASLTDRFDGIIARKYNQITNVGKIGDPIADKLLTGGAMIVLSMISNLPWAITILIFVREWIITILRLSVLQKIVLPAKLSGKIKTNLQIIGIGLYIIPLYNWTFFNNIPQIFMLFSCVWTVYTGMDYFLQIRKLRKK
jgi:CDP-diacylglycerol--glycerol-3-phosphate 3-phosphatidyltransferase